MENERETRIILWSIGFRVLGFMVSGSMGIAGDLKDYNNHGQSHGEEENATPGSHRGSFAFKHLL